MDILDFIVNDNNKICSVFKKKYRKKIIRWCFKIGNVFVFYYNKNKCLEKLVEI